jgi:hypothetical protein
LVIVLNLKIPIDYYNCYLRDGEIMDKEKLIFYLHVVLVALVQVVDMLLTKYWVGNDYSKEQFFIMQLLIKNLGINNAIYLSTFIFYFYLLLSVYFYDYRILRVGLIVFTWMYISLMVSWIFVIYNYIVWVNQHVKIGRELILWVKPGPAILENWLWKFPKNISWELFFGIFS